MLSTLTIPPAIHMPRRPRGEEKRPREAKRTPPRCRAAVGEVGSSSNSSGMWAAVAHGSRVWALSGQAGAAGLEEGEMDDEDWAGGMKYQ